MKTLSITAAAVVILFYTSLEARPKRVNQIPNGAVNRCANCHIDPAGGGPRNLFGQMVEAKYLTEPGAAGDVMWGPELAHEDADGDGFTNGEELQDSAGIWTGGSIGDPSQVYFPGNPDSHPPVTSVHLADKIPTNFELLQNYPNPFNPSTTISFSIPEEANVQLFIFDALGRKVDELINGIIKRGAYNFQYNAERLNSGVYFYRLATNEFTSVRRMILMR